ncbi:hypothetical protein MLPF_2349 [Mycobacterium lepromatosis]|nr:hypothetical protein MLPF_2349 [Mycobacterium lepromatosis]
MRSMLMDRVTLLTHETQWDRELALVNTDPVCGYATRRCCWSCTAGCQGVVLVVDAAAPRLAVGVARPSARNGRVAGTTAASLS